MLDALAGLIDLLPGTGPQRAHTIVAEQQHCLAACGLGLNEAQPQVDAWSTGSRGAA